MPHAKTMSLVYVAGPFRGATRWHVRQNTIMAERIGFEVMQQGFFPVIPHTMTENFDGQQTDQFWLDGTLELMRRCDAVLAVPPYTRSEGTKAEIAEAKRLGIPVFRDLCELAEWEAAICTA